MTPQPPVRPETDPALLTTPGCDDLVTVEDVHRLKAADFGDKPKYLDAEDHILGYEDTSDRDHLWHGGHFFRWGQLTRTQKYDAVAYLRKPTIGTGRHTFLPAADQVAARNMSVMLAISEDLPWSSWRLGLWQFILLVVLWFQFGRLNGWGLLATIPSLVLIGWVQYRVVSWYALWRTGFAHKNQSESLLMTIGLLPLIGPLWIIADLLGTLRNVRRHDTHPARKKWWAGYKNAVGSAAGWVLAATGLWGAVIGGSFTDISGFWLALTGVAAAFCTCWCLSPVAVAMGDLTALFCFRFGTPQKLRLVRNLIPEASAARQWWIAMCATTPRPPPDSRSSSAERLSDTDVVDVDGVEDHAVDPTTDADAVALLPEQTRFRSPVSTMEPDTRWFAQRVQNWRAHLASRYRPAHQTHQWRHRELCAVRRFAITYRYTALLVVVCVPLWWWDSHHKGLLATPIWFGLITVIGGLNIAVFHQWLARAAAFTYASRWPQLFRKALVPWVGFFWPQQALSEGTTRITGNSNYPEVTRWVKAWATWRLVTLACTVPVGYQLYTQLTTVLTAQPITFPVLLLSVGFLVTHLCAWVVVERTTIMTDMAFGTWTPTQADALP